MQFTSMRNYMMEDASPVINIDITSGVDIPSGVDITSDVDIHSDVDTHLGANVHFECGIVWPLNHPAFERRMIH